MEVFIRNIPYAVDELQLTRELASVLHGQYFQSHMGGAPFNFLVRIFKGKNRRQKQHGGCGVLVVPSVAIGELFLAITRIHMVSLHGRTLYAQPGRDQPKPEDLALLTEPYQDPAVLEEQRRRYAEIKGSIRLHGLQFCWPCHDGAISIEWESPQEVGWTLEFDPETHRFIIKSQTGLRVVVTSRNVQSIALDSQACVLSLERPPIFEREKCAPPSDELMTIFMAMMLDEGPPDTGPTRDRLVTLDESRGDVFAFLRVIRITFHDQFALRGFKSKAKMFGLTIYEETYNLSKQGLFDPLVIGAFRDWLRGISSFDIAFQIDGLVSRCRFNPKELWKMKPAINAAIEKYGGIAICDCIRLLEQRREEDAEGLPVSRLFDDILHELDEDRTKKQLRQSKQSGEIFHCHRVTVTPTSLILTGPLPDETNRVLRKYMEYQSHFIRVEFRDEDRLHLRLDREVDSPKFLDERIGTTLQQGLVIAGRRFEFLAYSSSALKEHAVWFIHPFFGDDGLPVDAESIRASLGDFSKVIYCPARYGARIAQAFSTTESSITAEAEELINISDRKSRSGSCFTDGVGVISLEVAEEIWELYTETRSKRSRRRLQTPSAYQIRLGGFKGMLCVYEPLKGRVICTRPSMSKFTAPDLTVEIAQAFDRPISMNLNRPLIMLLETLGVPLEPIMQLQKDAVRETVASSKSAESAAELLQPHGLGTAFHMPSILLNLHKLDVRLESTGQDGEFISFLKRVLKFAVNHVLRDLKYKARIPVKNAWTLVGVADEYGYLEPDEIYAYVCTIDGRKEYVEGPVLISRSPTVHPGDARMVRAIGKPPPSAPAGLGRLTNCVVFSCKGERSLPSMLAGGDLDGDIYCLVMDRRLHPRKIYEPAPDNPVELVEINRPSTAQDIAQFVVDFIKNDLLGVIATQILLTADISKDCMADRDCVRLAALHSTAVDFPKTGRHVSFNELPRPKNTRKPDWYANETNENKSEFYPSNRHIGHLFRDIYLPAIPDARKAAKRQRRKLEAGTEDVEFGAVMNAYSRNDGQMSRLLMRKLDDYVDIVDHARSGNLSGEVNEMLDIFEDYVGQLAYTCSTHSLSKWTPLTEEEVVAGTIVAKCSQPRMRSDTISDMRRDSTNLATLVREEIEGPEGTEIEVTILRAWTAWKHYLKIDDGALIDLTCTGTCNPKELYVLAEDTNDLNSAISHTMLRFPHKARILRTLDSLPHGKSVNQSSRHISTTFLGQDTVELKFDVVHAHHRPSKQKLVLCHGLFGSKQNFRSLARQFSKQLGMDVYCVDLRNHGSSPHSTNMTYTAMAADLLRLLQSISSTQALKASEGDISLLGHSMGGKVVMTLALHPATPPNLLRNLIVEDISPIKGRLSKEFEGYARAMRRIMDAGCTDRKQADQMLQEIEPDVTVRQFLLTNVSASSMPGSPLSFRVPADILADSMADLGDFAFSPDDDVKFEKPTLVIRGTKSKFVKDLAFPLFDKFFPNHEVVDLNTGHWVHAEDPKGFTTAVMDFVRKSG